MTITEVLVYVTEVHLALEMRSRPLVRLRASQFPASYNCVHDNASSPLGVRGQNGQTD